MPQLKTMATLQTQTKKTSDGHLQGVANSLTTTRDGTLVTQAAGEKVVGKTVPLLLSHDWDALPIGSVTMQSVDDDGLHYDGELFDSAPDREQILEGVNSGVLAVSIGFLIDSMDDNTGAIKDIDLLELSITPVPADAKATVTQELKIESEDEQAMNEDGKKKQNEEPDTQAEPVTDEPTLQDVLDAINGFGDKLDQILKAVAPDENDNEPAAQSLDTITKGMLELSHDKSIDIKTRIDLQNIAYNLKGENL